MGNVLIVVEQRDGKLRSPSLNAFTFGKKMLEAAGGDLDLPGDRPASTAPPPRPPSSAPRRSSSSTTPRLEHYLAETYAPVVAQVAKEQNAGVVAATATAFGKDLLPRVAALLDAGMASDVVGIAGPKTFKRPMVAGNVIAKVEVTTPIVVATARQTEFAGRPAGRRRRAGREGRGRRRSTRAAPQFLAPRRGQERAPRPDRGQGRRLRRPRHEVGENFKQLEQLTDLLGGALGATRAACDAGMVPNDLQVGQTGKVVAPDLYVAVGVCGAIQHLAGMKGSKVIVAINKDPEAPDLPGRRLRSGGHVGGRRPRPHRQGEVDQVRGLIPSPSAGHLSRSSSPRPRSLGRGQPPVDARPLRPGRDTAAVTDPATTAEAATQTHQRVCQAAGAAAEGPRPPACARAPTGTRHRRRAEDFLPGAEPGPAQHVEEQSAAPPWCRRAGRPAGRAACRRRARPRDRAGRRARRRSRPRTGPAARRA